MSEKILTDILEPRVAENWTKTTTLLPGTERSDGLSKALIGLFYLLFTGRRYDVIVLSGDRMCLIFADFAALLPIRYPPVIFVDCLWYIPATPMRVRLKNLELKLVNNTVAKFIVWSSHEIEDYAKAFGIPEEKFVFIHHHHTLESYSYTTKRGDYIFSGGDGDRDYPTLLKAVDGLDVQVKIATRRTDWAAGAVPPSNVQAFPTSFDDFRVCMAQSLMVVIPMQAGLLHSGGQQTYLNAMAMGKPVIVAGERGARDYIQDGVNGLLVPPNDPEKLQTAIKSLLDDPEKLDYISSNAASSIDDYSTILCMERITALALAVVSERRGSA